MAFSDAEDQPLSTVDSKETRRLDIERQHLELIKKGMQGVLLNDDLKKFNVPELKIAGKTGTAEFPGPKDAKGIMPTHGWFTAFAPYDNPEVSVTVFVQRGGGPSTAAPIAIEIIKRYFRYSGPPVEATPTSQLLPPTQVVAPPTQAPARSTTASAGPTGTPAASTATPSGR
jgi:penicillin-binding protein 2